MNKILQAYIDLGLKPMASQIEVREAFEQLSLEWQPQRYPPGALRDAALSKSADIQDAYELLQSSGHLPATANLAIVERISDNKKTAAKRFIDIHGAALAGDLASLLSCIAEGQDVNDAADRHPPLMSAASAGHTECVAALIAAGADIHCKNDRGVTALVAAAMCGQAEVIRVLAAAGADVDTRSDHDQSPLMSAATAGKASCIRALIETGADVDGIVEDMATPLMMAAIVGHNDCIDELIAGGADVNLVLKDRDALRWAIAGGYLRTIRSVIRHGANVTRVIDGKTPSDFATTVPKPNKKIIALLRAAADKQTTTEL